QAGPGTGTNPPRGAILNYGLKSKPKGALTLEVLDASGKRVAKLSSKREPGAGGPPEGMEFLEEMGIRFGPSLLPTQTGVNRFVWDMTYEGPSATVQGAVGWPPPARVGPAVAPGSYTLKLKAGGKTYTQTLVVRRDPRSKTSAAELDEQLHTALAVRDDVGRLATVINQLRSL